MRTNLSQQLKPSLFHDAWANSTGQRAKPFLKWAGGKSQLLTEIDARLPHLLKIGRIHSYVEPFVGGGAVLFHIAQRYPLRRIYLTDVNQDLVYSYTAVRDHVDEVIEVLSHMDNRYGNLDDDGRKEYYYEVRNRFNENRTGFSETCDSIVEHAALLIFLNHTCFNGLFRMNKQGQFNVPFGGYRNPQICAEVNLRRVSSLLQNANVRIGDFELTDQMIDSNTFVYFDPPYRPISKTSSFTSYSPDGFGDAEQRRLAEYFRKLDVRGAALMLSNSDPKNENPEDAFFDDLYKGFHIERVAANRMINCNAAKRGRIKEVIIRNYDTSSDIP